MQAQQQRWRHRTIALALILAGAVLSVYPVAQNVYHDWQGTTVVHDYSRSISAAPPAVLDAQAQAADRYNASLTSSVLNDPWTHDQVATSPEHDAYVDQLAGFGALGRIRMPSAGIDLPIHHDATRHSLNLGAGHMYGTSLPVGGAGTHSVIAGHTGDTIRTYFNRLHQAVEGDLITIESADRTLTYRVDQIQVVSKDDLSQIQTIDGADLITLVTCIVGHDDERLLVRGTRETPAADAAPGPVVDVVAPANVSLSTWVSTEISLGIQEWMRPRLAVAAGALVLALGMVTSWVVSGRRRAPGTRLRAPAPAQHIHEGTTTS